MPARPAADFNQRVQFLRPVLVRSRIGPETSNGAPTALGYTRAAVRWGSGAERVQASMEGAAQSATFRCRALPLTRGVLVKDVIRYNGMDWDVTAIAPLATNPPEIEFTATASRG